jgi:hypothetical protein
LTMKKVLGDMVGAIVVNLRLADSPCFRTTGTMVTRRKLDGLKAELETSTRVMKKVLIGA